MNQNESELLPYSGSIDGLLEKCANLDVDVIEQQVEEQNKYESLYYIMEKFDCSIEEAEVLYEDAMKAVVKEQIDVLVAQGKVKIVGTDADGETLYAAVDAEKKASKKGKKVSRKKS